MNTEAPSEEPRGAGFAISLYLVAFMTGAIVMSFEMLGSRYPLPRSEPASIPGLH